MLLCLLLLGIALVVVPGEVIENKRSKCKQSICCSALGGKCIKKRSSCLGPIKYNVCKKKKCICCLPPDETTIVPLTCPHTTCEPCPTCSAVTTCPSCPTPYPATTCPDCGVPPNGNVTAYYGNGGPIGCKYECHHGFRLEGSEYSHCLDNGTWSPPTPKCITTTCPDCEAPPNGNVRMYWGFRGPIICKYECNHGFRLEGSEYSHCLDNGTWSPPTPKCIHPPSSTTMPAVTTETTTDTPTDKCCTLDPPGFWIPAGFPGYKPCSYYGAHRVNDSGIWRAGAICCQVDICTLQKDPGDGIAMALSVKYYFNVDVSNCQSFIYRGEGGNANRFLTYDACMMKCGPIEVSCDYPGAQFVGQPEQCLYFSTEADGRKTWDDAVIACADMGGEFASLLDPQAVVDYARNNGWDGLVGGSDKAEEGTWRWLNGQLVGSSLPWVDNEPDNNGNDANCMAVNPTGYWDVGCWDTSRRYICDMGRVSN